MTEPPPGDETYPAPAHGWCCFHCGVTFHTPNSARDHFGLDPKAMPACLFDGEHVAAELRKFRATEAALRPVLERLYGLREMLDGAMPTESDADTLYNLCQSAIEAINGVPVPEWELTGRPAPWPFNKEESDARD